MEQELRQKIIIIKNWLGTGSINIFGLPFSGKDTHGNELASFLEGPLIGGGDIIRASKHAELQDHIASGKLAPTDQYLAMVLPYLSQEEFNGKPLVLSSVGRWSGEDKSVHDACEQSNHPIKAVIYLRVPETEIKDRWRNNKRERHDDASEDILNIRLSEFREKTLPVIDFYRSKQLLLEVDATPSIPLVTAHIIDRLHELAIS
jgi:adenylate kinase